MRYLSLFELTRGVLQLSAPGFLKPLGLEDRGMERYPNIKLAAEINFSYVKNSVKN